MKNVKIERLRLLNIVIDNKAKHLAEYTEAVVDYKIAVTKVCKYNLSEIEANRIDKLKKVPDQPQTYENSYVRAIRMLELSAEDIIELDELTFNQLVLDEWQWKHSFSTSNTAYKSY